MAINTDGTEHLSAEPNVVPMIDILLVLLIIFMIMIPMSRMAIDLQLPDPQPAPVAPWRPQIVLEVLPNERYAINQEPVAREQLGARLREIYEPRPEKIIFVKGDGTVTYQNVVWAMDVARDAGVKVIGIPPRGGSD